MSLYILKIYMMIWYDAYAFYCDDICDVYDVYYECFK